MRVNFMMVLIAISFFAVAGLMASQAYVTHEAVTAGLQQCRVGADYVWQKVCQ